jgi:hypothetical protein
MNPPLTLEIIDPQEPSGLTMTHLACYYCGYIGNDIRFQYINYYFGIKHCLNQSCCEKAKRDCANFMRKENRLLMEKKLIARFGLADTMFSVVRSNGKTENDWKIYFSLILNFAEFLKRNEQWYIKVYKSENDLVTTKMVPVASIDYSDELIQKLIEHENYPNNDYIIVDDGE